MDTIVSVEEAQAQFPELLEHVIAGERVVITRVGKPVATLLGLAESSAARIPGQDRGEVVIAPNFDAPVFE